MKFRLGTTSYILPAGLLENAEYLAGFLQDMELVLFDLEDGQNNIPSKELIQSMRKLAEEKHFSYTVHLPMDLKWRDERGEPHPSMLKAQKAIMVTRDLSPLAYVTHLDARQVNNWQNQAERSLWQDQALQALQDVAVWAGGWQNIALENLEGYPLNYLDDIFNELPVGRCIDIGHWWLDSHSPVQLLNDGMDLQRVRVIHLHGISPEGKDHSSLTFMPRDELAEILELLDAKRFSGVLTLEVFGELDFFSSLDAIQKSIQS